MANKKNYHPNFGGARPGAGRKSRAEELGLPALIDEVIGTDGKKKLLARIHKQAMAGSEASQKLLMEYIYGKPTEHKKVDAEITVKIEYGDVKELVSPRNG